NLHRPRRPTLLPCTTLFRALAPGDGRDADDEARRVAGRRGAHRSPPASGSDGGGTVPPVTSAKRSSSRVRPGRSSTSAAPSASRSEEHTSELQSRENLVCRL